MAVILPQVVSAYPTLRVLTAPNWGAAWRTHPWPRSSPRVTDILTDGRITAQQVDYQGLRVLRLARVALPEEGDAELAMDFGVINGRRYGYDGDVGLLPDLRNQEVRIQQQLNDGSWSTIWWGQCHAQTDRLWPGASTPHGTRKYYCRDALYRTRDWFIDRHQWYQAGSSFGTSRRRGCVGHPGFNVATDDLASAGNREPTNEDPLGLGYFAHTWPGAGDRWTDQEALEQVLASSRPPGEPLFAIRGTLELLATSNSWPIGDRESVRGFLRRVFDRRRARGVAFLDWDESSGFEPYITVRPQLPDDVQIPQPATGSPITLPGATSAGTTTTVDLVGDQRLGEEGVQRFRLTEAAETTYDAVEAVGGRIVMLTTLSRRDGALEERWTATEETAYLAASSAEREADSIRYQHVFARIGINRTWDQQAGDTTGRDRSPIAYELDQAGELVRGQPSEYSPGLLRIADELPIFAGYSYLTSTIVRFDGESETTQPEPLPLAVYRRVNDSPERWVDAVETDGVQVRRAGNGGTDLLLETGESTRFLESIDFEDLAITVGLELPVVLRVASVGLEAARRIKRIDAPELALHLAHPQAIWRLDVGSSSNGGFGALRNAVDASDQAGILRDDRDALIELFVLAEQWYTRPRFTCRWAMMDCGLANGWVGLEGASSTWPALGQLVTTLAAGGEEHELNTPITRIEYDHTDGLTTWYTSWDDRDWGS